MRLISAKEACVILDIRLARLYELTRLGVVPCVRLGLKQIRFDPDALDVWIKNGGATLISKEQNEADTDKN